MYRIPRRIEIPCLLLLIGCSANQPPERTPVQVTPLAEKPQANSRVEQEKQLATDSLPLFPTPKVPTPSINKVATTPATPLQLFEREIKHFESVLLPKFPIGVQTKDVGALNINMSFDELRGISFDVETTKSLVSPYIGYLVIPIELSGDLDSSKVSGRLSLKVNYAFQEGQWRFKNVSRPDHTRIDLEYESTSEIVSASTRKIVEESRRETRNAYKEYIAVVCEHELSMNISKMPAATQFEN